MDRQTYAATDRSAAGTCIAAVRAPPDASAAFPAGSSPSAAAAACSSAVDASPMPCSMHVPNMRNSRALTFDSGTLCLLHQLLNLTVLAFCLHIPGADTLAADQSVCFNMTPGLRIWLMFAIGRQLRALYIATRTSRSPPQGQNTPCRGTSPPRSGPAAALMWPRIG